MRYAVTLPAPKKQRYWLVDTGSLPEGEVLRRFYGEATQPMFRWLYDGTAYQGVRDSGPVLLDITQNSDFWQQCCTEWVGVVASVVIDTNESLDDLQQRLAANLTIHTTGNGKGLLRFHEPAVLHLLLGEELLSPAGRLTLMGKNTSWYWALCRSQENIIYEHCSSGNGEGITPSNALRLDDATQQRLTGLRQFSRLMPLMGDAINRFGLLHSESEITSLWRALERYWSATWQTNLPRKQAVENARDMLVSSHALEQFMGELGAYVQNSSLGAMR
ncbi:MAG: DUF4123 domain-containing protein [Halomonas sp.]|nr:DUF4123 domain-containing protein [Halomonas sp.]TVP42470.1 MAG: DUF4123 domain-containing protein [Halomonas sp.]